MNVKGKALFNWIRMIVLSLILCIIPVANLDANSIENKSAASQAIAVTGLVTDNTGLSLPGVNITESGTTNGTISDADGNYSINVASSASKLVFSYIGFEDQEVSVNGRIQIDVVMIQDVTDLDEVVVVGYAVQKKINVTGSVAVIDAEVFESRPVASVEQALQGASPNLNITTGAAGGEPGSTMNWNIRGAGSITGSNSPLILVDGVQMDINSIAPESIESVSVLKDAAATAIYGARAPFGVVLITTKQGKKGRVSVTYNNNFGFASGINLPQFASSINVATAYNQATANSGKTPYFDEASLGRIQGYLDGEYTDEYDKANPYGNLYDGSQRGNTNYNWVDQFFKGNSMRMTHNLSVSGGSEKTSYFLSAGSYSQEGLYNYGDDSYKRRNVMANINTQVNDWIAVNFSTKYSNRQTDYPVSPYGGGRPGIFKVLTKTLPTSPMFHEEGHIIMPMAAFLEDAGRETNDRNDLLITLGTTLEPVKGWVTKLSYNHNFIDNSFQTFNKDVLVEAPNGSIQNLNGEGNQKIIRELRNSNYDLFNVTSAYSRHFGDHFTNLLVGYEQEYYSYVGLSGDRLTLFTPDVPAISAATGEQNVSDSKGHSGTQGFFARFNYNYKEKYLFEINARANGSSRFAQDNRWGFFPSASVGYNISKEAYWNSLKNFINTFKIRASYGSMGNQNVPNYLYLSTIPVSDQLRWVMGDSRPLYSEVPNLISPTLTWETITTTNFGTDLAFFENKLSFVFEYFIRETSDMFGPAQTVPAVLGTDPPQENNAELMTKGWEISLTWKDAIANQVNYRVSFMIGDNQTVITKYVSDTKFIDDWYEGKQFGEIWGFETDGFIQNQEDVENMPDQSQISGRIWGPGDIMYKDLNGDDEITYGEGTVEDHGDLKVIGNSAPRYNYGISLGADWKGFDFSMFWQGVAKRDMYIQAQNNSANHLFYGIVGQLSKSTMFEEHLDYWRPDDDEVLGANTDAYYPKPYSTSEQLKNLETQSKYLLSASYLRLKNLQFGYTLPQKVSGKLKIQKFRVYVSGENLYTITNLTKLLDPESATIAASTGIMYPLSRVLSFGMNLTF